MRSRQPLELSLPGRKRWPWIALGMSVAVHSLLLLCSVEGRLPRLPRRPERIVILTPIEPERPREIPAPYFERRKPRVRVQGPLVTPRRTPELPPPVTHPPPKEPEVAVGDTVTQYRRPPIGWLRPGLGSGELWVRPLPLPPKDLARRLDRTHAELVDSAVTAIIQAFLDSVSRAPGADAERLPKWVTKVGGVRVGLDSQNIYVAGLKIPAAVLALIPLQGGVNQNPVSDGWDQLYVQLRQATARATTMEEFKQAVRDLRQRKQEEHDFEKAQREAPDSSK